MQAPSEKKTPHQIMTRKALDCAVVATASKNSEVAYSQSTARFGSIAQGGHCTSTRSFSDAMLASTQTRAGLLLESNHEFHTAFIGA